MSDFVERIKADRSTLSAIHQGTSEYLFRVKYASVRQLLHVYMHLLAEAIDILTSIINYLEP